MEKLAWGIIGTGAIAKAFAEGVKGSQTGRLQAVGSRKRETAEAFGEKFGAAKRYGFYEELIGDRDVQAVYIATPHPLHAELAIRTMAAGKHVLVEKPMALNQYDAMAMVEAARRHDVFFMEAYMYRCHPQTKKLVELVRSGAIGEVRFIQGTFSFHWPKPWNEGHRLIANELGGGGILDVGGYPVSMARLIAGAGSTSSPQAASGKAFADPVKVEGAGRVGKTGVDEWAACVMKFESGIVATCAAGVQVGQENVLRVYGSEGWMYVPVPWVPARNGGAWKIVVHRDGKEEEVGGEEPRQIYAIEADTVSANLAQREAPEMTWADSLGNMRALDAWRKAVGVAYAAETPEGYRRTTVAGAALSVKKNEMIYGQIAGVAKKCSRLVMGVDNQLTLAHGAVVLDDWIERGGTFFDTGYVYGGGQCERVLGQWLKLRGVREEVVILGKGAHTPWCDPKSLVKQLDESLGRMQTSYVDVYMMHRDNLDVPVGEFVDVLNEQMRLGRMRAFGGSNWTIQRVQEANEYAARKGLQGFAAISNNFSLARMVEAPWAGCASASDAQTRAWLSKTQMPLLAWSSQARGFFLEGKASPEKRDDAELARCWYSEDNFKRLERVKEMAAKRGVRPINIALAYVLAQPFPTFALIGPRTLEETRTSLVALGVKLSADEVKWLNLEE